MRAEDGEIEEKRIALTLMMHCCYERNQKKTMRQNKAGREKGFGFRAWRKETDDDNQKPLKHQVPKGHRPLSFHLFYHVTTTSCLQSHELQFKAIVIRNLSLKHRTLLDIINLLRLSLALVHLRSFHLLCHCLLGGSINTLSTCRWWWGSGSIDFGALQ